MQSQFSTSSFEGFPKARFEETEDDYGDELLAEDGTDGSNGADDEDEDELDLPVDPDEGMPVIPDDDERVVDVPS